MSGYIGIKVCRIIHVMIFYIMFLHLVYVLHVAFRPNDYKITSILPHITSNVGDIFIFPIRTFEFIDVDFVPINGDIPKTNKGKKK